MANTKTLSSTPSAIAFAVALDVLMIALFAIVGRQNHAIGLNFVSVLQTMWPFVIGLLVGWLVFRVWRNPFSPLYGLGLAALTIVFGQLIRILSRTGAFSIPFILVSVFALLLLLVGWRLIGTGVSAIVSKSRKR
ncbi:DUF3054 family protein [Canibacter sp. lx-72]|uniref:DUF3054 domain-containing protein n=1 Tax=Canibacter zhuwentaonis TaxID=2837491 RepID=UPI001BDD4949|nr:DUF3054 domain-containing protein [Canibacter zhuwentaonis]MBT1017973.1 DUF3054 family protein [Canibacter zhuwentaonis]MBT1035133.1 DUF3054 family protein [Canibacter zhuwentaonis]